MVYSAGVSSLVKAKTVLLALGAVLILLCQQLVMVSKLDSQLDNCAKHTVLTLSRDSHKEMPHVPLSTSSSIPNLTRLIVPPRKNQTAAVCAIVKDEDAHIEEWTDYHVGLGFDVFLYDNSKDFELEQWGDERRNLFGDPVLVQHFPGQRKQIPAYRDCAQRALKQNYTWIYFADADEFLVIKDRVKYPHVVDLLREYAPRGELTIWWRLFGSSNRRNYEPVPVTKRFQYRVPSDYVMNHQFKSIIYAKDLNLDVEINSPHWMPTKKASLFSTDGSFPNQTKTTGPEDVAVIHHYNFKSQVEFLRKRLRGSAYSGYQKWIDTARLGQTQNGDPIPAGSIFDDAAWQILKRVAPRYQMYDDFYQNRQV